MRYLFLLFLLLCASFSYAQDSIPSYSFSLNSIISTSEATPFWLIYGRNGKVEGNDQFEAFAIVDVKFPFELGKKWKIEAGLQGIARNKTDESNLQEAYLNISFGSFTLKAGKEEYTISQYSDELSSGSYYLSNNARPVPGIGIGFYDYVDVPLTNGYVQVKGFLNQGVLDDDRGPRGTENPLFHEKIAYIRTNKLPFNPHIGINHSALFGGKSPRNGGTEIPVDYIATFMGQPSDKVGEKFGGEATNVAGAHLGLVDFGVNFDVKNIHIQTYYQKPFTDRSGFIRFFERNRDHLMGAVAEIKDGFFVQEVVYENVTTVWQSGPGAFDPYVNGRSYVTGQIEDFDQFLFDNYGIETEGISQDEFMRFIERMENHGFLYGGRDNYYNNGLYYKGWSYGGMALGSPLFLTVDRMKSFLPGFDDSYDGYFANTRIKTQHFGVRGMVKENLSYKLKYTHTRNYGTYQGLNKGNHRWESANPNSDYVYYFEERKTQTYLLLEGVYSFNNVEGLQLHLSMGYDYGDMYKSFGTLVGVSYSGNFK